MKFTCESLGLALTLSVVCLVGCGSSTSHEWNDDALDRKAVRDGGLVVVGFVDGRAEGTLLTDQEYEFTKMLADKLDSKVVRTPVAGVRELVPVIGPYGAEQVWTQYRKMGVLGEKELALLVPAASLGRFAILARLEDHHVESDGSLKTSIVGGARTTISEDGWKTTVRIAFDTFDLATGQLVGTVTLEDSKSRTVSYGRESWDAAGVAEADNVGAPTESGLAPDPVELQELVDSIIEDFAKSIQYM